MDNPELMKCDGVKHNELTGEFRAKCDCYHHAVEFYYDKEVGTLDISFWQYGVLERPFSMRHRLCWMWKILWSGNLWADQVCFSLPKIKALHAYLGNLIKQIESENTNQTQK